MHDFYCLPVLNIPNAYCLTLQKTEQEMALEMIYACLGMWPLMIIVCVLLLDSLSGFLIPGLTKKNFPEVLFLDYVKDFGSALFVYVGFGDKVPNQRRRDYLQLSGFSLGTQLVQSMLQSMLQMILWPSSKQ